VRKQASGPHPRQAKAGRRQARQARERLAAGGLSHQDRRKLRSVIRTRDATAHRRRLWFRHMAIALAGAVAATAVAAASVGLGSAIDAARGQGTVGTFVLGFQSCSVRTGCTYVGTFRLPDGDTVADVAYDGTLPDGASPGSSFPALRPGGSHRVYPPHGSLRWLSDLLFVAFLGGAVGFVLWMSPLGLRGRDAAGTGIG
jgi:ferric-dicitrate binding protein FerR (iron transport regulator)